MIVYFRKVLLLVILVLVIILSFPLETEAYLDPGTGSQLLQLLLASLFGALFTIKMYWKKLKEFFKNLLATDKKENDG